MERNIYKIGKELFITSNEEIKEGDWYLNNGHLLKCTESKIRSSCKKIILTTDQDLIKDGVQAIDDEFLEWFVKNPNCEEVEVLFACRGLNGHTPIGEYKIIIPSEEVVSEYDIMPNIVYGKNVGERIKIKAKIISKEEPKPFKNMEKLTKVDWEKFKKNPIPNKQETLEEAKQIGQYQQELFNYLHDLGVTALQSEMQEIERIVLGMQNINALHFEIDALKREIKLLKNQKEKEMYSEEDIIEILIEYNYLSVNEGKLNSIGTIKKWFEQFKNK